ncbi:hypothetical protein ACH5RR_008627 [Cinchona calisaya]|uniref:Uncharacterized protein n=1 Tax=Cinchona calisaya TaxID=153742 RepID=A0ABD3AFS8_9GENT
MGVEWAYTLMIIPMKDEHLWKPINKPKLHPHEPIILPSRPKKVRKRELDEAPTRRKKSSQIKRITRAGQDQQDGQSAEDGATANDDAGTSRNIENTESAYVEPAATAEQGTCIGGVEKTAEFEQTSPQNSEFVNGHAEDEAWLDELILSTVVNIASQEEMPSFNIVATKEPIEQAINYQNIDVVSVMHMVITRAAAQILLLNFIDLTNPL